jgi:hypothetical protein
VKWRPRDRYTLVILAMRLLTLATDPNFPQDSRRRNMLRAACQILETVLMEISLPGLRANER